MPGPIFATVKSEPIEIVEYDADWPASYEAAAEELRHALEHWLMAIEHVGSTAVPGLAAKPVIDIQAGVTSLDHSAAIVAAVEALGYEYVPEYEADLPNRRYFRRLSSLGQRTHQIHLIERSDREWWDRHLAFRDWLRSHPLDRDRYAELKRRLAIEFRHDRVGYTDAKGAFVREIEHQALARPSA